MPYVFLIGWGTAFKDPDKSCHGTIVNFYASLSFILKYIISKLLNCQATLLENEGSKSANI